MAIYVTSGAKMNFNGYGLGNRISQVTVNDNCEPQDATVLTDTTRKYVSGLSVASMEIEGFDDYDASQIDVLFNPINGTSLSSNTAMFTYLPNGDTTNGDSALSLSANMINYEKTATIGELAKFRIMAETSLGDLVHGKLLQGSTSSITGVTGNSSPGVQVGAVASGQTMVAHLHVLAGSSPVGFVCRLEHCSTVGGTYSTTTTWRFNGGSAVTVGNAYRIAVTTTTTDTYWRLYWASTSGTLTVACVAGVIG